MSIKVLSKLNYIIKCRHNSSEKLLYRFIATSSCRFNVLSEVTSKDALLDYKNGLVTFTIPLIARKEKCLFTLKPFSNTIGDFVDALKTEDKAVDNAAFYTIDGVRISQSTLISLLVKQPFKMKINDVVYLVEPPARLVEFDQANANNLNDLNEMKSLIAKLYHNLNIQEHQSETESELLKQMENIKSELEPMEKTKEQLAEKAKKHTNRMIWLGLGLMSVQAGVLARLTWFDYSWDIIEPISYFVTYTAIIGVYSYFVLTRKEYDYESASDRIFLRHFHKNAAKSNLNVEKYNQLKDNLHKLELNLKQIKDKNASSIVTKKQNEIENDKQKQ